MWSGLLHAGCAQASQFVRCPARSLGDRLLFIMILSHAVEDGEEFRVAAVPHRGERIAAESNSLGAAERRTTEIASELVLRQVGDPREIGIDQSRSRLKFGG